MGKIKILEEKLIDKIAAGEVIERPVSIVKELVENSLDANASSIDIDISEGGKKSIKVSDDGEGMDRDDLILAFDRHATSKIFKEKDLYSITTMGFRGEAIPSISSVSLMTLRSGTKLNKPASEISVHGGTISKVNEVAPLKGTIATVNSLFYNTPARRKFLKSAKTEYSHIVTWVQNISLSYFSKKFSLTSDRKLVFNYSPVPTRKDRISQIFGVDFAREMIAFKDQERDFSVEGFISRKERARKNRSAQRFYVNGRLVKDRFLSHATWIAYKDFFQSSHPILFLFITISSSLIDVNVHPSKMEVRFNDSFKIQIENLLQNSIRSAFKKPLEIPSMAEFSSQPVQMDRGTSDLTFESKYPHEGILDRSLQASISEQGFDQFRIIGQHKDTFIIASESDNVLIVDQHIAHERILFEELEKQMKEGGIKKQKLIFPLTVECSPEESAWLDSNIENLKKIGVMLEPFGKNNYKVEEVPAILPIDSIMKMIKEMATEFSSPPYPGKEEISKLMASIACHSAVKSGSKLDHAKMEYILRSLFLSSNPYYCPHGRPIMLKIESSELKKRFQRSF